MANEGACLLDDARHFLEWWRLTQFRWQVPFGLGLCFGLLGHLFDRLARARPRPCRCDEEIHRISCVLLALRLRQQVVCYEFRIVLRHLQTLALGLGSIDRLVHSPVHLVEAEARLDDLVAPAEEQSSGEA